MAHVKTNNMTVEAPCVKVTRSRDHMRKHLGESHVIGEGQGDVTKDNAEDELK